MNSEPEVAGVAKRPKARARSSRLPVRVDGSGSPSVLTTLASLLRVEVVGVFILTFLVQPFRIPSGSMIPTLQIGDCVLVSKADYGPRAGHGVWAWVERSVLPPADVRRADLVVFHFPPDPGHDLVKRVVAMPGERLRLHDGRVFINGRPLPESYAFYTPGQPEVFRDEFPNLREADPNVDPHWWMALRRSLTSEGELTVPAGMYFVLGDNRNNSEDSRYWGFVPRSMVVGRPLLVYFAVPNGADAPEGGPLIRLVWVMGWVEGRFGVPR